MKDKILEFLKEYYLYIGGFIGSLLLIFIIKNYITKGNSKIDKSIHSDGVIMQYDFSSDSQCLSKVQDWINKNRPNLIEELCE